MVLKPQGVGILIMFKVSSQRVGFPILQFADDTLMLIDGDFEKARVVKIIC